MYQKRIPCSEPRFHLVAVVLNLLCADEDVDFFGYQFVRAFCKILISLVKLIYSIYFSVSSIHVRMYYTYSIVPLMSSGLNSNNRSSPVR